MARETIREIVRDDEGQIVGLKEALGAHHFDDAELKALLERVAKDNVEHGAQQAVEQLRAFYENRERQVIDFGVAAATEYWQGRLGVLEAYQAAVTAAFASDDLSKRWEEEFTRRVADAYAERTYVSDRLGVRVTFPRVTQ